MTKEKREKNLRSDEIVGNILRFMIAGYETTSTTLAYCTYILATKPHIQEKLVVETVKHLRGKDFEGGDDLVRYMTYIDLFIREVLHVFPIIIQATSRECNTSAHVCVHQIEKGFKLV